MKTYRTSGRDGRPIRVTVPEDPRPADGREVRAAYWKALASAEERVRRLQGAMLRHASRYGDGPVWAAVGDLNHVGDGLAELLSFLDGAGK